MALKRTSCGSSSASPKKQKFHFEVSKVVQAIDDYASLPMSAKEMLCSALPFAASAPDQPHEFKKNIVAMVESTLKTVADELQAAANKARTFADESGNRERVEQQLVDAARSVAEKKGAVANREADLTEAQLHHQRMNSEEKSIRTKHTAENAEYERLNQQKNELNDLDRRVALIKTQPMDQAVAKKLNRDLKLQGLNASLLTSFSAIVARPVADRTTFDGLTMQNLEDELGALSKNIEAKLQEQNGPHEIRAAALGKAHQELDEAKSKMNAATSAVKDAQHRLHDAEDHLTELKDTLDNFAKHLKQAHAAAHAAEDELGEFQKNVLTPFREWIEHQNAHGTQE